MADNLVVAVTLIGVCLVGWPWRGVWRRFRLPPAVSLMALGSLVGSSVLGLLPDEYLAVAPELSRVAFVLLLIRAGLALDPATLRAILLPGIVLGTLPVAIELFTVAGLSRAALFERWDIALLAGFLVAAVSPAVVLPTMLNLREQGLGTLRHVPERNVAQTIMNAFVAQTGILLTLQWISPSGEALAVSTSLALLPLSLLGGIVMGAVLGGIVPRAVLFAGESQPLVPAVSVFGLGCLVYFGCQAIHLEGVLAVLSVGIVVRWRLQTSETDESAALRTRLARAWQIAELVLFVNLGAVIRLDRLGGSIMLAVLGIIAVALVARVLAVHVLLKGSQLNTGERTYVTIAHLPKATIQAVFGAVPLAWFMRHGDRHLEHDGQTLLIMAVLAILATAPVGAFLLERTAVRFLGRDGRTPVIDS